jgi:hypothetical protein
MRALPPPAPGQDLSTQVMEQGLAEGRATTQLDTAIVKSVRDSQPPGGAPGVPVRYVETSRTAGVADLQQRTYTPGVSTGTAYIFDRRTGKFACMAEIRATNSATIKAQLKDRDVAMWLELDLMAAIEREIVANARAISTSPPATTTPSAQVSKELVERVDDRFEVVLAVPRNAKITWDMPNDRTYGGTVGGIDIDVRVHRNSAPVTTLAEAVRLSIPSDDHVVQVQRELGAGEFFVSTAVRPGLYIANHYLGRAGVRCGSSRTDIASFATLCDQIVLAAHPRAAKAHHAR